MDIRTKLLECLDELGILIDSEEQDINLQEYIIDSLQFISFILAIEQKLNIEMPDEMLLYEKIESFNGYCEAVLSVVRSQHKAEIS